MKKISLTKGKFALVDDADFEYLNQWKWCASKSRKSKTFYAMRNARENGKNVGYRMHSVLMQTPKGMKTDHRNGDGLDNRRENLRVCNHANNLMNQSKRIDNKSGYKGVRFFPRSRSKTNPWRAEIRFEGKTRHLGLFPSLIAAAEAYDKSAKELFGDFAKLNLA